MLLRPSPSAANLPLVGERRVTVGISDVGTCSDPTAWLCTYALGSCVAVLLYAEHRRIAGLLHFMLADSQLNPAKAAARPGMFADTGLPALLSALSKLGVGATTLRATLVGGGNLPGLGAHLAIGTQNQDAARALVRAAGIIVRAEDLGGAESRSAFLHVGTGRVVVKNPRGEVVL